MKYRIEKILRIGLVFTWASAMLLCSGCGVTGEPLPDDEVPADPTTIEEPRAETEQTNAFLGFSFADVADSEFYFSSGAGAWRTVLHIHEDSSFDGCFQDSDMGDATTDYPNGTVYYSEFSGSFTEPERVDDATYQFRIRSLEYAHEFGEEIKDGFRYVYTNAYGLHGAEELYIYLPGSKIADLPEAYRTWVGYDNLESMQETELSFYGLYNVKEENGFSSDEIPDPADQISAEIAATEQIVAELNDKLQDAMTQADMNIISGEIYESWDHALNLIWGILKENLDADTMKQLTAEQLDWIAEKEAAVQETGAEIEGGSMYALVVNSKAAELTRERIFELAEYL